MKTGSICNKDFQTFTFLCPILLKILDFFLHRSSCLVLAGGVTADGRSRRCLVCFIPSSSNWSVSPPPSLLLGLKLVRLILASSCNTDNHPNHLKMKTRQENQHRCGNECSHLCSWLIGSREVDLLEHAPCKVCKLILHSWSQIRKMQLHSIVFCSSKQMIRV